MSKTSKAQLPKAVAAADVTELLHKVKKLEHGEQLDLSSDEDLSIAVMNLISIEEHLFFTSQKTSKSAYLPVLAEVREMRKTLLKKLIKEYEGEVWCTSKHLLSASMRLMEVGTKALGKGDLNGANDFFSKAYQLYSLFWGLNLKLITPATGASVPKSAETSPTEVVDSVPQTSNLFGKLGEIVKKAVDCCRE